ncbi:seminal plasma protein PDC-109-like [Cervus canadensis]|uniref:seminal plasma protein PDC-109-like n=1 Tax=Cervus canadensis TaxID=1574408 RepID=UPI001CA3527F|nr:seminal plasma protein PDC-109-like [Cervus canadensis]
MAPCLGLFLIWAGASVFLQLVPVNGGDLPNPGIDPRSPALQADYLPVDSSGLGGAPYENNGVSTEHTGDKSSAESAEDKKCVFPFTYGNKKHFDCTFQGSIFPWCSLDADYTGRWKYCTKKDYAKCVFPFIFGGKKYETCTRVGSLLRDWCSVSPNYDQDKAWKYC